MRFLFKALFLLLFSHPVFAFRIDTSVVFLQLKGNLPDTVRSAKLISLAEFFLRKDYNRAIGYAKEAIEYSRKAGNKRYEASALNTWGDILYRKGEFDEAEKKFNDALAIYTQLHSEYGIAETKDHLGTVFFKQGDNEKSIKLFMEALRTFEKLKSAQGLTSTYINIGLVYDNLHDFNKGVEYYSKAIEYGKEASDEDAVASAYNNLGGIYTDMGQIDLALECLERSMKLKEKNGNRAGVAGTVNNIGAIYYEKGNLKLALEYFQKAYLIKQEQGDKNGMISSCNNIGAVYYDMGNYAEAEKYFTSAYQLAVQIGSKTLAMDCLEGLVDVQKKSGNYKAALDFKEKFCAYKDTLFNIESSKNVSEIQAKFETEKKEQENEILSLKLKNESIVKYIFICAALVMFVLAFFIFRGLRQKQKANLALEEKSRIIEQQKHIVEEQNKDIRDSIKYAERIQTAIFPPDKMWNAILPNSFVYFKPKDILSGDFYWVEQRGDLIFVAAADCTGHGVPGALISIVNYNLLNKAVLEQGLTDPADILNAVNRWLTDSLHQTFQDSTVRDGMDVALCVLDKKNLTLSFAGANNPVYIFTKNGFSQINANKFPVGAFVEEHLQLFETKTIKLEKDNTVYLFSDGYADQFGGPNGKKFKYKQFQQLLAEVQSCPMQEQKAILEKRMIEWKGNLDQIDDILVVGLRV